MEIVYTCRSCNPLLFDKSQECLGETLIPYVGYTADGYIESILKIPNADWVVNIDEDAFVLDKERLLGLVSYMQTNGYHVSGVPDGGVIKGRTFNPLSPNAFFNIFDVKYIRGLTYTRLPMGDDLLPHIKNVEHLFRRRRKWKFIEYEPYYKIFFGLLRAGCKFLYLNEQLHQDQRTSILLDHENKPVLYHTWYARLYRTDPIATKRIDDRFNDARKQPASC